jgi:hypothetical protein
VYLYIYIHTYARFILTTCLYSSSNPQIHARSLLQSHLYLRSLSYFFLHTQIGVSFLKYIVISHFFSFLTSNDVTAVCPFINLTLILTNTSAMHLRIWKGRQFENTIKSDSNLR